MESTELRLGSPHRRLEIEVIERVPAHLPRAGDVRVSVSFALDGFGGRRTIWLGLEDLTLFHQQLRDLFNSRVGVATLQAMSRDEFSLDVEPLHVRGCFEARVRLTRRQHGEPGMRAAMSLEGSIEISSEYVNEILTGFRRLTTAPSET